MRSYSSLSISLLIAGTLACELKGGGDTDNIDSSGSDSSDASGTEGMSSTGGDPATSTGGSMSGTSVGTSASSTTTADPGTTTADPGTSSTSVGTSVGTSVSTTSASDTTGDPVDPMPCEGEGVALAAETLAYLNSQIPPMPDPTGGSTSTTGGEPVDPDTLYVRLSSQAATCADPTAGIQCGPNWEITIRIPSAFQTPGLYHLSGPDVTGTAMETGADDGQGSCSFGGGSFFASFELTSIDDKSVSGRLCHVQTPFFDNKVNLEGSFVAPRCP